MKLKVLYGYRPGCVKNATGIPVFVKSIFEQLKKDKQLKITTTGCFMEYVPKRPYRIFRFIPAFYYGIYLPLKLTIGRYDFYIENDYFFTPLYKPRKTKIITVVHDIGLILFDHIQTKKVIKQWRWRFIWSMKNTDIIITVSNSSKKDIETYLKTIGLGHIPVYTVYNDVQLTKNPAKDRSGEILNKYGLQVPYFLFLGTLEPRKNPLIMIKAFHLYKQRYKDNVKFVIAGGKGWLYQDVMQYIHENSLEEEVVFTGYVSEIEKYFLLKNTICFVFLSIYEGFGIPPLEALKMGVPVLVSDIPVFRELFEGSVWYGDKDNIVQIADTMHEVVTAKKQKNNKNVLRKFSWEQSAKKVSDILFKEAK